MIINKNIWICILILSIIIIAFNYHRDITNSIINTTNINNIKSNQNNTNNKYKYKQKNKKDIIVKFINDNEVEIDDYWDDNAPDIKRVRLYFLFTIFKIYFYFKIDINNSMNSYLMNSLIIFNFIPKIFSLIIFVIKHIHL